MTKPILHQLADLGQSLWLDNISRSMITSGQLQNFINQGLRGQTSNPTIFKQAISIGSDYDQKIMRLAESGRSTFDIYDDLTIQDVADAADLFRQVYEKTLGLDGYVSLEINPKLGHELETQLKEGLRLWQSLNRPNVMIKVPATKNGIKVFEELTAQGINVNATLIFSGEQYSQVVWAYLKGLNRWQQKGGDLNKLRSVASVFVSRVDTAVDKWLDERKLIHLRGQAAVANAQLIYHKFQQAVSSLEFKNLQAQGANDQRVLWASTGTKDPTYSDLKYVTELMVNDTVNTVPDKTLMALLDHGRVKCALPGNIAKAQGIITYLREIGIDVGIVCNKLLEEGLMAFEKSFEDLMATIEEKSKKLCVK